jgi:hypothetical protein
MIQNIRVGFVHPGNQDGIAFLQSIKIQFPSWQDCIAARQVGKNDNRNSERSINLQNEEAKARLKRLECPYVLKDKRGNVMTNLCF